MDHVPPKRFFPVAIRQSLNPQLRTLPTHTACNTEYREDEEYFVLALGAFALGSYAGGALLADLKDGLSKGHARNLYDSIKRGFGTEAAPDGRILFSYDRARIERVVWKITRGMLFLQNRRVLPTSQLFEVILVPSTEADETLPTVEWFPVVVGSGSLCPLGAVFDMKAIGGFDGEHRVHFQAFLFWDKIIALVRFHDPTCPCEECAGTQAAQVANQHPAD